MNDALRNALSAAAFARRGCAYHSVIRCTHFMWEDIMQIAICVTGVVGQTIAGALSGKAIH
jgi:hypothetical protein